MKRTKFTTIYHAPRLKLGLTCNEYVLMDIIYHLSRKKRSKIKDWCYAKKQTLADMMGISKRSIINLIKKLENLGLLCCSDDRKFVQTTDIWEKEVIESNYESEESSPKVKKVHNLKSEESSQVVKKVHPKGEESSPPSNRDSNKDNTYVVEQLQRQLADTQKELAELKTTKKKRKVFKKPTIEEVNAHFAEKGSDDNEAENFHLFYESKNWMVGKSKMTNWKAAATKWIKRNPPTRKAVNPMQTKMLSDNEAKSIFERFCKHYKNHYETIYTDQGQSISMARLNIERDIGQMEPNPLDSSDSYAARLEQIRTQYSNLYSKAYNAR